LYSSKDTQGDGFVNWHCCADAHPDCVKCTNQKHRGRNWASEWVLELVDGFQKRNCDQTNWDRCHGQNAQELVRDNSQGVESWEKVPLWQNLKRGCKWIRWFSQLCWFHYREADAKCDGSEDHDGENVQKVVWPRGFTVVVVAHTLGELSAKDGVRQVGLLDHRIHHQETTASLGSVYSSSC